MSNPIAFLLGAGASFPYGVPMMIGFYNEFRAYVQRRHPPCFSLLEILEHKGTHARPDLETLLSDLQALLGVSRGLALIGKNPKCLGVDLDTAVELRGYLDAFIVDRCERFDRERSSLDFRALLDLRHAGPVWVFSTNYDRIVEHACETHGVTWSDGFEAGSPKAVANWIAQFDTDIRIVKLHGSVNWYEDDPAGALHRLDRGYSLPAHDFRLQRGDQRLKPLMIIPTLEKDAMASPYIGLAVRFTDQLKQIRILIVAGSSLRDRHIQAYIQERLSGLHVLLVNPSAGQSLDILGDRSRTHPLDAGFAEFLSYGGSALVRLAERASTADDAGIGAAIEGFVAETSRAVEDAASANMNPDLQRLWKQVDDSSISTRTAAIKELAKHSHPAVMRRLIASLKGDTSPVVRVSAVDSLVRLAGQGAADILGQALVDDVAQEVQMEAALGLIRLDVDRNRGWLERGLGRENAFPAMVSVIREAFGSKEK